jgi:5-formyltetrahydrofolate cyclo-ligase
VDDADGTASEKKELRVELLAARDRRSPDALERDRSAIRGHVLARAADLDCVAAYQPLRTEPGSVQLLAALHANGVRVIVPITLADRDLDWAEWSPAGAHDRLGREAVATAGLVLLPALAVARDGTRLGRGGGSYDRALARASAQATLAALVFDDEVVSWLPRDPRDRPVGAAVTPSGWITVGRNTDVAPDR